MFKECYNTQQMPPNQTPNAQINHSVPDPYKRRRLGFLSRLLSFSSTLSTIILFLMAPVIAVGVTTFMYQSYEVDGESMETTLQNNDRLIVDKLPRTWSRITKHPYIPHRGDIIIFNQLGLLDSAGNQEKQLIKRVIGLPGDHLVIKDGSITIYNAQHPDGFNPDQTVGYSINMPTTPDSDQVLKQDEIFVCGDNRANSADSRVLGPIKTDQIVGKLAIRILPISKAEKF